VGIVGSDLSQNDPSRTCTVDGQTIPNYNLTFGLNFVTHCEINGLTDGKHTIEVTVTTANPDGYWFDFLMYIPSASVSRTNTTLMIDSDDSSMTYGSGWTPNAPGYIATQSGATMSIQFTGTQIHSQMYISLPQTPHRLLSRPNFDVAGLLFIAITSRTHDRDLFCRWRQLFHVRLGWERGANYRRTI
jgi:hypothetical protein